MDETAKRESVTVEYVTAYLCIGPVLVDEREQPKRGPGLFHDSAAAYADIAGVSKYRHEVRGGNIA